MLIDQFTVVAQILNFVILLVLLNRFLFRPVRKAIQSRQERIENQWQVAQQQIQNAKAEIEAFHQKQCWFDQEKSVLWQQAQQEVDVWRQSELSCIKKEWEELRSQWLGLFEQEKQSALLALKQQMVQRIFQISQHVVAEMMNVDLEQHLAKMMISRLEELPEEKWRDLAENFAGSRLIWVCSSFALDAQNSLQLQEVLQHHLGPIQLRYDIDPQRERGIEIELDGCKLGWVLDHYIRELEEQVSQNLANPSLDLVGRLDLGLQLSGEDGYDSRS